MNIQLYNYVILYLYNYVILYLYNYVILYLYNYIIFDKKTSLVLASGKTHSSICMRMYMYEHVH